MSDGYDFKIVLSPDVASCTYDTPNDKGRTVEGSVRPDPYLETAKLLEQWLKRWERISSLEQGQGRLLVPETFNILGNHLWKLALDNDVGERLIDAYQEMRKDKTQTPPIRVRLSIQEDSDDLSELPWEFVRFPGRPDQAAFVLAGGTRLVLCRYLDDAEERDIRPADGIVRVLFIIGLPDSYDSEDEKGQIREMLDNLDRSEGEALSITPISSWQPRTISDTLADLKQLGQTVDVVHLVAICRDDKDGAQLLLPTEGGGDKFQDPGPVVRALTEDNATRPELVVLHLGDWRRELVSEHFERLAPSFIKAGIPAVLAMQYPMTPPHGPRFLADFYSRLVDGVPVGQAVQAARHGLTFGAQLNRHFGAPVLYLQSAHDGPLLRRSDPLEPPAGASRANDSTRTQDRHRQAHLANDVKQFLLDSVAECSPDVYTARELELWIESVDWPDDLDTVWQAIKAKWRAADDVKVKLTCNELMRRVTASIGDR
jgi:hypothetical protein